MSVDLKEKFKCYVCKRLFEDPVYFQCCNIFTICKKHLNETDNEWLVCLKCNKKNEVKSIKIIENEHAKCILEADLILTDYEKELKSNVYKLINEYEKLYNELIREQIDLEKLNIDKFSYIEIEIGKQKEGFKQKNEQIKDFHETKSLNKKIEKISEEVLTKSVESCQYFQQQVQKLAHEFNFQSAKKRVVDEFRNVNIITENVYQHEQEFLNKIKEINNKIIQAKNLKDLINKTVSQQVTDLNEALQNLKSELLVQEKKLDPILITALQKDIKVYEYTSGKLIKTLRGHNSLVRCLLSLPNNQLASGSDDGTIKIWDILNDFAWTIELDESNKMQFMPSQNKYFLIKGGHKFINALCFSENLFAGVNNTIKIINIVDKSIICSLDGHTDRINSLVILRNKRLASASRDATIKVWDLDQGSCINTLDTYVNGHFYSVNCLIELENGRLASGSDDKTIKIWNLESSYCDITFYGHVASINGLDLSKNKGELLSCSNERKIKRWNLESKTFRQDMIFEGFTSFSSIKVLPNEFLITCGPEEGIRIWNMKEWENPKNFEGHLFAKSNLDMSSIKEPNHITISPLPQSPSSPHVLAGMLKLSNNGENSCYSNSILQCLLHLGETFCTQVINNENATYNQSLESKWRPKFPYVFKQAYDLFLKHSNNIHSSEDLRRLVAGYPPYSSYHYYTDYTQQDAYAFFLDLFQLWDENLQKLFKFETITTRECCFCHNKTTINDPNSTTMILSRSSNPTTPFYSIFEHSDTRLCPECKQARIHVDRFAYKILQDNQYILIHLSLFIPPSTAEEKPVRLNSKLIDFNPKLIKIPSSNGQHIEYQLMSAVIHFGENLNSGHYIALCRDTLRQNWIKCNDTIIEQLNDLEDNIKDAYLLFLKRI